MVATLTRKQGLVTREEVELTPQNIVRAWEDRNFRARLTPRQLQQLPDHPAGFGRLLFLEDPHTNGSSNNCSSDNCSSSNCSSSNCSSDNCSSSNCSSSNCSSSNCSADLAGAF